jgi:hypothetical protein
VIVSAAVALTFIGTTDALLGVIARRLELQLAVLTEFCFHGDSVRESGCGSEVREWGLSSFNVATLEENVVG